MNDDYEKREEKFKKKIQTLTKNAKDNKVLAEIKEDEKEEEMRRDREEDNVFRIIHRIIWAGEELYMEGEINLVEAIDDICEALQKCKDEYKDDDAQKVRKEKKENRAMARDIGYA